MLSRKVLLLALLNVGLLALCLLVFARVQLGMGTESLLLGPARDRIQAIANSFRLDLQSAPPGLDEKLLPLYNERYGASFYLIDPQGRTLLGPQVDLPADLITRLRQPDPSRPPRPAAALPPPKEDDDDRPPPPEQDRVAERPPPDGRGPEPRPRRDERVFVVNTSSPTAYWAGVRMPVQDRIDHRRVPAVLLIRSSSLFTNGLFFDWRVGLALPLGVAVLSILCWLPFVRGLTKSVANMSRVTGRIAEGHFDAHVADDRRDELGLLGGEINQLAARLGSFVKDQKRFLGDIAHELSAPIARIQFALGILEQRMDDTANPQVAVLRDEIQEMSGLVNELLSFSKAGMDAGSAELADVPLAPLLERVLAREIPSRNNVQVTVDAQLSVHANEHYLTRALSNLLRNANRYAGDAGPIAVSAVAAGDNVIITVADSGPGVPDEDLASLFNPFYRPESSRSRDTGGVGLGLAIVKSCIDACRGTVTCRNRKPAGLEVEITLTRSGRPGPSTHS